MRGQAKWKPDCRFRRRHKNPSSISRSVEKVNTKVESVNLNIHQLVDANLRIEQVMGIVSAVSETGISVSQETSAASQQQMSTTEEIENSAKSLVLARNCKFLCRNLRCRKMTAGGLPAVFLCGRRRGNERLKRTSQLLRAGD